MTLKDRINEDIKAAMRAKDEAGLRALRAIKSAIMVVETAEGRDNTLPLREDEEMALLLRQAKQRRDSIEQFEKNGRHDLAQKEHEELAIISRFLPKALSPEELKAEVQAIIAETGASSIRDMGKVMGIASARLAGRAEGKAISELVKQLLA